MLERPLTSPSAVRIVALVVSAAAVGLVVVPFWPAIVFALWTSGLLLRLRAPVARAVRSPAIAAALLTLGLVLVLVVPLVLTLLPLTFDAIELVRRTATAGDARTMLRAFVEDRSAGSAELEPSFDTLVRFAGAQGSRALPIARSIAGATTHAIATFFVFIVVAYSRLLRGDAWYAWLRRHAPLDGLIVDRLAATFDETGRGLFVGIGGAALAQATVATVAYLVVGVPHPLVLGALTFIAAIIPGLGTALAWLPIAGGLAISGRPYAALTIVAVGILLVGTIDNVAKPLLAPYGRLRLAPAVVFIAMLGGFLVIGPTGILLAPLAVRWAKELLIIERERDSGEPAARRATTLATRSAPPRAAGPHPDRWASRARLRAR